MSVSLICACKNRIDALRVSLNSWVRFKEIKEIIIVDWNSDQPIDFLLDHDPRIKIIRTPKEEYFNQPQPLNLALDFATGDYVMKVDCDYIINPYYSFFDNYKVNDDNFVCGEYVNSINESELPPGFNYFDLGIDDFRCYEKSYSPIYKFLIGLLYIKRSNLLKIGGYNENLNYWYAFEDEEIFARLDLLGLEKVKIDFDNTLMHIPHGDNKRTENFRGFSERPDVLETIQDGLSQYHEGDSLNWQSEYVLSLKHVQYNKEMIGEIKEYKVERICEWEIEPQRERYFYAYKKEEKVDMNNSKLNNFPLINYISLEESENRRKNLHNHFEKYGITDKSFRPLISKRFDECDDVVFGSQVEVLDSGTKGCVVSHIKMIKKWYEETDEDYGFFCEDDLSLESVKYWDFTWEQFIERIPEDADCVQLYCIREQQKPIKFEDRWLTDWSVTAYILTRDYAKKIIDQYYVSENEYNLEIYDTQWYPMPENVIFYGHGKVYSVNLFLEDLNISTTFNGFDSGIKENHLESYKYNIDWWKSNSKDNLNKIFGNMKSEIKPQNQPSEKYVDLVLDIEELLTEYSYDTENAEINFKIGLWYEANKQDAPALSFFLRSAERAENDNLAYESLIHGAYCYDRQGTRDLTAKGILQQALSLHPERPEVYYHLSTFCRKRGQWQECHVLANIGLLFADVDHPELKTDLHYPGKYALLFEKAVTGWEWGKTQESFDILWDLKHNYDLPENYKVEVDKEIEKYKRIEWYYSPEYLDILNNLPCNIKKEEPTKTSNLDLGKIDLILAGHYDQETSKIVDSYLELPFVNNIIISTWEDKWLTDWSDDERVIMVKSKKPSPGTDNRNYQIVTSQSGLDEVTTEYCARMRTDQKYTHDSMNKMYDYMCQNVEDNGSIFVAGIYPNLLFHPRDHVFWGKTQDIKNLFDVPLEKDGFSDKMNIPKEELWKYYDFFERTETYIGSRYCARFNRDIIKFIMKPDEYLFDNAEKWQDAYNISQEISKKLFKPFPREGIDLEWNRKGLQHYPYDDQKNGYGECWAEDL